MPGYYSSLYCIVSYIFFVISLGRPKGFKGALIVPYRRMFDRALQIDCVVHGMIVLAIASSLMFSIPCNLLTMIFSSSPRSILDSLGAIYGGRGGCKA